MPHRIEHLIHFLLSYSSELKIISAAFVAVSSLFAQISTDLRGIEDLGVKAIFGGALIWCVRLLLAQQAEHKKEVRDIWIEHKRESDERESRSAERTDANTKALNELTLITKEQTDYFKTVTRTIVEDRINAKPTPKIP